MPGGQVMFPWIVDCWESSGADEGNPDDPCYKDYGGWWFGFVAGPAQGDPACPDGRNVDGYKSTETNKVEAKIKGKWESIVGPDYDTCEGPAISDPENGDSFLDGALEVKLTTGGGLKGPPTWDPDMAVLAVNLNTPPYAKETDMSKYAQGFYLKYESDHTADHTLQLVLGWEEGIGGIEYGYDTWFAPIKVGTGVQTQEFRWAKEAEPAGGTKLKAGDFIQEGWDDGSQGALKFAENTIVTAVTKMQAIKIELKNQTMVEQPPVNFKIIEFGFVGGPDPFPIAPIVRKAPQNIAKFSLNGKVLSLSSVAKPVSVQIIDLQGALVHTQTLASGSINLSHLPAGVYIVRSPAIGYSGRIMLK
jgi:hypothetical protein